MRSGLRAAIAGVAGLAAVGIGLPVFASTNQPIAQTGGATVEIPLLGSTLKITVELDTTSGDIKAVNLDNPAGFVATKDTPQRVRFEKGTDGTTAVNVATKNDKLKIGVKSATLKDLEGSGTWSADVFGTGAASVGYTIGEDANGGPTIAIATPTVPVDVTATVKTDAGMASGFSGWHGGDHGDNGDSATGWVTFKSKGYTKVLTISVRVDSGDNATPGTAHLSFVLRGRDIQRGTLADIAGDHTWKGRLCDGTDASITYNVDATTGALKVTATTPAADVQTNDKGAVVSFTQGNKVMIRVFTPDSADGQAAVAVKAFGRHCAVTPETKTPPTVNTPVSTTTVDPNQQGNGDHHRGDHGGRGGKGGPTTSTSPTTAAPDTTAPTTTATTAG
jgi:hypothetical protein